MSKRRCAALRHGAANGVGNAGICRECTHVGFETSMIDFSIDRVSIGRQLSRRLFNDGGWRAFAQVGFGQCVVVMIHVGVGVPRLNVGVVHWHGIVGVGPRSTSATSDSAQRLNIVEASRRDEQRAHRTTNDKARNGRTCHKCPRRANGQCRFAARVDARFGGVHGLYVGFGDSSSSLDSAAFMAFMLESATQVARSIRLWRESSASFDSPSKSAPL